MGQLSPWGQDNKVQMAGLTVLEQRKGLCKVDTSIGANSLLSITMV